MSVTETDVMIITHVGTKKREKRGILLTGLPTIVPENCQSWQH